VATDILGQGAQRDVSAAFQWRLEHRAPHRIVDHDRGSMPLRARQLIGDSCACGEINKTVGRPETTGERPEFASQTALQLANLPESRGFLSPGNPGRFAPTSWWCAQSGQTGLRRAARKS
jgi:hypothetical protein